MHYVTPKVFLIGCTAINLDGLTGYLAETGQSEFLESVQAARSNGVSDLEILCSYFAKLCYKSLILGQNANVTKVRDIADNFQSIIGSSHGSVLEHAALNFTVTNCSRVLTHELVRHRVGTAFSQTSGRYVAIDDIGFVHDPILDDCKDLIEPVLQAVEKAAHEIRRRKGLDNPSVSFDVKKKVTSAIRRIAPNGQANEIGFSVNIRSLRHTIQMRTNRAAEWEIRVVFNQIARIVLDRWPGILHGHVATDTGDGLFQYENLSI